MVAVVPKGWIFLFVLSLHSYAPFSNICLGIYSKFL